MNKPMWILLYNHKYGMDASLVSSNVMPGREMWPLIFQMYEGHTDECEGEDGEGCKIDDHRDDEWVEVQGPYDLKPGSFVKVGSGEMYCQPIFDLQETWGDGAKEVSLDTGS